MAGAHNSLSIEYDDGNLQSTINRLIALSSDLTPVNIEIAEYLHRRTRDHFDSEQGPDGVAWAKVSPATQAQKDEGYNIGGSRTSLPIPGKALHGATLHLRDTIFPFWGKDEAGVSTGPATQDYAAAHQFGTQGMQIQVPAHQRLVTQAFGRMLKFPVWSNVRAHSFAGNTPARPYLGLGKDDEREILEILEDEILSLMPSA
uniref:phage virion morphogenesis protein n=1 Tax=Marinobacterium profundum TaxID=1714300 RepID=UPI00082CE9C2|nr:phage virion morphogenesis protein [Marinobacterium profundum]